MDQEDRTWLAEHLGASVLFDEPMSRHTTFRIGGPVEALVTAKTEDQMRTIVHWAGKKGERVRILGAGSNLLVADEGVRGLVVSLAGDFEVIRVLSSRKESPVSVEVGAAVPVSRFSRYAWDKGLVGFNFAIGIPGTVGGALRMNAGAWGGCMADHAAGVRLMTPEGNVTTLEGENLRFSYRRLELEPGAVILSGRFELDRGDPEMLRAEGRRIQDMRKRTQPLSLPSAGSVFRNPPGPRTAGELIDKAGLKGARVGDAEISTKHANFIVNRGQAKASEVLQLIDRAQKSVWEAFGVLLETEVTFVGEEAHT